MKISVTYRLITLYSKELTSYLMFNVTFKVSFNSLTYY